MILSPSVCLLSGAQMQYHMSFEHSAVLYWQSNLSASENVSKDTDCSLAALISGKLSTSLQIAGRLNTLSSWQYLLCMLNFYSPLNSLFFWPSQTCLPLERTPWPFHPQDWVRFPSSINCRGTLILPYCSHLLSGFPPPTALGSIGIKIGFYSCVLTTFQRTCPVMCSHSVFVE